MKRSRIILLVLVSFILASSFYGYYLYNKPVESTKGKEVDISIEASQLLKFYTDDEENSNKLYLDKIIAVSGKIRKIDNANIYLETGLDMSTVICEMEDGRDLSELQVGENVVVKGVCTGFLMDVVLVRCTLLK